MTRKNFTSRAYTKNPIALAVFWIFVTSVQPVIAVEFTNPITNNVDTEEDISIAIDSGVAVDFAEQSSILIKSTGNLTVTSNSSMIENDSGVVFDIDENKNLTLNLDVGGDFSASVYTHGENYGDIGGILVRETGVMTFNVGGDATISTDQENADSEHQIVRGITTYSKFTGTVQGNLTISSRGFGSEAIKADRDSTNLELSVGGKADLTAISLGSNDTYGVVNASPGILSLNANGIDICADHQSEQLSQFGTNISIGAGNLTYTGSSETNIHSRSGIKIIAKSKLAEVYGITSYNYGDDSSVDISSEEDIQVSGSSNSEVVYGISSINYGNQSTLDVSAKSSVSVTVDSDESVAYGIMTLFDSASNHITAQTGSTLIKASYVEQEADSGTLGNDGFGQSFAIYAYGNNETIMTAGKANQLFGALCAAGGATIGLTGDTNAIASFAVIDGAGNLDPDKGSVISALYAEGEATSVTLTGQNILTTYADNTNEAQLERVVWAYDGADVTLDGPVLISTNRYEISPNSLDIAVAAGTATELSKSDFAALVAEEQLSKVTINYASGQAGSVNAITGDILAGYAGRVSIQPRDTEAGIVVNGNLLAGNGGELKLSLGKNGVLAGRSDDYFDAGDESNYSHIVFFNPAFSSNIIGKGSITLEMSEGSQWYVRDQSWLTNLEGSNGTIYLTEGDNGSDALHIQRISGQHTFVVNLSHDSHVESDMLYINEAGEGAETQVLRVNSIDGLENMTDGDRIRFATVNSSQLKFVVEQPAEVSKAAPGNSRTLVRDVGFYDVSFLVESNDRQSSLSNEGYDGTGQDDAKPGSRYVDLNYGNEENAKDWYLARDMANDEVSDGGEAVLATARAAYWNAVEIDRLNKRLGDVRHAGGAKDGLWVRLRHDRMGTDAGTGDFRTHNTTYQFGYDHALASDDGRRLFGAAIDYMDADTTYRNVDGTGATDRFGITAYTTWIGDDGWYYDVVGRWGVLSNSLRIVNGSGSLVEADYDNHVLAASLEVGRKWKLPDTAWFIEPQAQAQFAMVTEASYSTNQGTRIDQDQINSAITRLGVRVGREFGDAGGGSFYAKADWLKEWHGHQGMRVTDATTGGVSTDASLENKGDWFDVGFGVASAISESTYFFADAEYVFGNNFENTWSFNAGVRWMFH